MKLSLDMQVACEEPVPARKRIATWLQAALPAGDGTLEVSVRMVGHDEMRELNERYRGVPRPTNVLSFPCNLPAGDHTTLLGDIVLCTAVIQREADEQGKPLEAHWAHMLVHGALHLQGLDHQRSDDAERMESEETRILELLGYPCPYTHTAVELSP